jgi:IMP cyclohydrolase
VSGRLRIRGRGGGDFTRRAYIGEQRFDKVEVSNLRALEEQPEITSVMMTMRNRQSDAKQVTKRDVAREHAKRVFLFSRKARPAQHRK